EAIQLTSHQIPSTITRRPKQVTLTSERNTTLKLGRHILAADLCGRLRSRGVTSGSSAGPMEMCISRACNSAITPPNTVKTKTDRDAPLREADGDTQTLGCDEKKNVHHSRVWTSAQPPHPPPTHPPAPPLTPSPLPISPPVSKPPRQRRAIREV
ncbi:unnamed protein product, partial [Pleuronectes platessa]